MEMARFFRASLVTFGVATIVLVVALGYVVATHPVSAGGRHQLGIDYGDDLALEKSAAIQIASAAAQAPAPVAPPPPGRLVIPAIGVNAPVLPVGVDKNGNMAVTNESYDVGWYDRGPSPGDGGDAVITGHLDWYDTSRAVFYDLRSLKIGDDITVQRLDGVTHQFRVTNVYTVAYNARVPGLFDVNGPPRLSLITCGGPWDKRLGEYIQRVIVDSQLVS